MYCVALEKHVIDRLDTLVGNTMTENQALRQLRKTLAYLYSDTDRIRIIVYDTELKVATLDISNCIETTWQNVLMEAIKQGKLPKMMQYILDDYSENQDLQEAWYTYQNITQNKKAKQKRNETNGLLFQITILVFFVFLVILCAQDKKHATCIASSYNDTEHLLVIIQP